MPKDEWYKDRQRDIAHKAAREIATGQPSSFDWISEDIAPDGSTIRDAGTIRGPKKRKSKIKKVRTGGKKPGSTITDVTPVRGPKKKSKIKNARPGGKKPGSTPGATKRIVVNANELKLLRRLTGEQKGRNRLLRKIGDALSQGVGSQLESRKDFRDVRSALADLRNRCAETITYLVTIQEMISRAAHRGQTATPGTPESRKQDV